MHLMYHGYFDQGKNPITPNWSPMLRGNFCVCFVSPVYDQGIIKVESNRTYYTQLSLKVHRHDLKICQMTIFFTRLFTGRYTLHKSQLKYFQKLYYL